MQDVGTLAGHLEHWHDFFILAGTAAATMMGLLFVSLSLHIEVVVADRKAHLAVIAREAFANFLVVLLLSLLMLSHTQSQRSMGVALLMIGAVRLAQFGLRTARSLGHDPREPKPSRGYVVLRFVMPLLSYLLLALAGVLALLGDPDGALGLATLSTILLIADAARCAWDLLARVGRHAHPGAPS